jgi:prepilin-type N-terminal cleavage/methylation domain-containing protein
MTNFKAVFRRSAESEDGLTLIELMVSIVIIVTVLLASAFALNSAFKAQAVAEIKSRGVEIAREQSEKAKQKNFIDTRIVVPKALDYRPDEVAVPATYMGEKVITREAERTNANGDLEDLGFVHRTVQEENGTNFTILTYVTQVTPASYDNAGANVQMTKTTVNGVMTSAPIVKRITVVVSWSLDGKTQSTSNTVVRSPTASECIPPRVEAEAVTPTTRVEGGATLQKRNAQERIQECEGPR